MSTYARTIRILVCGSRTWTAIEAIGAELPETDPDEDVVVIHGAEDGADRLAGICARGLAHREEPYPAEWGRLGSAAGPIRNTRMLAEGKPDRGLAFGPLWMHRAGSPLTSWSRTGTGDMVSKMLAAKLPVRWVASPGAAAIDLTEMPPPPTP